MKVFLPATAVMFFIGRILGGPGWTKGREGHAQRGQGRRQRPLVDVVERRPWNFENNRGGVNRKGVGRGGRRREQEKKNAGLQKKEIEKRSN